MGRLVSIAVLVAALAGGVAIAKGGVDPKPEAHHAKPAQAGATAVVTPAPAAQAARTGGRVTMRDLTFRPPSVTVHRGRSVRFTNRDDVAHDVYALLGGESGVPVFRSRRIAPGHGYSTPPLTVLGAYSYVCTLHPTVMRGVIHVVS